MGDKMATTFKFDEEYWGREVKRYLFARLDSLWSNEGLSYQEVLDFIHALTDSTGEDLKWIATLYHINQPNGAWDYIVHELPEYLNTISWRTEQYRIISDRVRGRILWNQTYLQRISTGRYNTFVLQDNTKSIDSEENRLLVYYLNELANIQIPHHWSYSGSGNRIGDRLVQLIDTCRHLLQSTYLREVSWTNSISSRMISLAKRSKSPLYARLADLCIEYEKLIYNPRLDTLKDLLSRGWIQPKQEGSTDDLFELYVLISSLNAIECLCNEYSSDVKTFYNIIRPGGSRVIAKIKSSDLEIEVTYDRSPKNLFGVAEANSVYRNILSLYTGINGNSRRPDVLVRIKNHDREIRVVIEAKNTDSESSYANDSVYKALGYLKDYEGFWRETQSPKIVLAFPYGVKVKSTNDSSWLEQDLCLVSGDIKNRLQEIFVHLIQQ